MQRRKPSKEAPWREGRRGDTPKAGPTHPGRSPDNSSADPRNLTEPCTMIRRAGDYQLSLADARCRRCFTPFLEEKAVHLSHNWLGIGSNTGCVAKRKSTYYDVRYHPLCTL